MVIKSHPRLDDGSPFPTLFWLTCPVLAKRVSALESEGWMTAFNVRLGAEPSARQRLTDAIDSYRAARDRLEVIEDRGSVPGGGPERVKCVHAHVAHQLAAGDNPVGAAALSDTGWPDCLEPCFRVET
jgi:hypothetical protein